MFRLMYLFTGFATWIAAAASQPAAFSFAGVTLDSNIAEIVRRYPHSTRSGDYISVAPEDSHDHISGIAIFGAFSTQRVRITLGVNDKNDRAKYPPCVDVQRKLEPQFGPPVIRKFDEEATRHADRYWRRADEALTLVCFYGADQRLVAGEVLIDRLK